MLRRTVRMGMNGVATPMRLELDGEKVTKEERLLGGLNARIRDVRAGPDGAVWLATDSSDGRIIRLTPAK